MSCGTTHKGTLSGRVVLPTCRKQLPESPSEPHGALSGGAQRPRETVSVARTEMHIPAYLTPKGAAAVFSRQLWPRFSCTGFVYRRTILATGRLWRR